MLLKLSYLGKSFHGYAFQPGLRTVEGELKRALRELSFSGKLKVASRTDRGVSALFNVVFLDFLKFPLEDLCRALSSKLKDIWIYGFSEIDSLKPKKKHYIYFLPSENHDLSKIEKACEIISGRHDFTNFCILEKGKPERELEVFPEFREDLILLNFYARSFLWQQVRRISQAISEVGLLRMEISEIEDLLSLKSSKKPSPAPPENLLLYHLEYDFEFKNVEHVSKIMKRRFTEEFYTSLVKKAIFLEMVKRLP
ncbi:MAG: tRNA pseudouridine(38-40) synthase TruA [Candidatus Methanofastidiosia archaeon]